MLLGIISVAGRLSATIEASGYFNALINVRELLF